ncbi:hypothetical protein H696_04110 [Fonticula alba]|uniref:Uncharacterized protein n=1 Tax=Fonticula alba TaxID=691883 RepID=A0A058Z846_FONAL|nr:hypothetical protein H696_04110 [Fonticula alba]KCV69702.1 hypothetical protein H696_04110 [Fonticula alba]|eukprot:XP_009496267.1 hypothetical protein H696_04110 [Fonticula alba]
MIEDLLPRARVAILAVICLSDDDWRLQGHLLGQAAGTEMPASGLVLTGSQVRPEEHDALCLDDRYHHCCYPDGVLPRLFRLKVWHKDAFLELPLVEMRDEEGSLAIELAPRLQTDPPSAIRQLSFLTERISLEGEPETLIDLATYFPRVLQAHGSLAREAVFICKGPVEAELLEGRPPLSPVE